MAGRAVRIATRGSELALFQARRVAELLGGRSEMVVVSTEADVRSEEPLWRLGGRGVFVKEIQAAVLDGRADVAVHSAKDLPSTTPDSLVIGAVPERADARDALVGTRLDDLPTGAVVATGSVRRRAQLAARRPDLSFASLRGNIRTRLDKAVAFDAAVVAAAALTRLRLEERAAEILSPDVMVPQVAQGALAVECRIDDDDTRQRLAAADDATARLAVTAERAFLAQIGGGCNLPVGAHATPDGNGQRLVGMIASLDGRVVLRHAETGGDPAELGRRVARELLDRRGGRALLAAGGDVEELSA